MQAFLKKLHKVKEQWTYIEGARKVEKYNISHMIKIYMTKLRLSITDLTINVQVTYNTSISNLIYKKWFNYLLHIREIHRVVKRRLKIQVAKDIPGGLKH